MKVLGALVPRSRREWGEALLAESEHTDRSIRWMIGGLRLIVWSWFDWIFGGNLMKTVVATLSTINVAMSSSGTRVPVWLRYLCSTPGWGLGGVDAVWPATRVGEGSVFS